MTDIDSYKLSSPNNESDRKPPISGYFTCSHLTSKKFGDKTNCHLCGSFLPVNGSRPFKTQKMHFGAFFNPHRYYQNLFQSRLQKFTLKLNSFTHHRVNLIDWMYEVAEKLKLSLKTIHLAIMFLDYVVFKDSQILLQTQLYAAVSLMLAAKSIELDERIPFLSRLRKYSTQVYSIEEFRKAEIHMVELLAFKVQLNSLLELLDFYTSQGIVYSTDLVKDEFVQYRLNCQYIYGAKLDSDLNNNNSTPNIITSYSSTKPNSKSFEPPTNLSQDQGETPLQKKDHTSEEFKSSNKEEGYEIKNVYNSVQKSSTSQGAQFMSEHKLFDLVSSIQKDLRRLSNYVMKDDSYLDYDQKILGAACVAFIRGVHNFIELWPEELTNLTGLKYEDFSVCFEMFVRKFERHFTSVPILTPLKLNISNQQITNSSNIKSVSGFASPDSKNIQQIPQTIASASAAQSMSIIGGGISNNGMNQPFCSASKAFENHGHGGNTFELNRISNLSQHKPKLSQNSNNNDLQNNVACNLFASDKYNSIGKTNLVPFSSITNSVTSTKTNSSHNNFQNFHQPAIDLQNNQSSLLSSDYKTDIGKSSLF